MPSKIDQKSQATADRIKAAAFSAAKGLSRPQAERAVAAATRNVNAYGQKEEGPSRWQERKEAKRQMYICSTEKAAKLGERKDLKPSSTANFSYQCQKCYQTGHWTYECKNERVYISRPSRTQQLKNPKLMVKVSVSYELENPDIIPKETMKEKVEKISKNKSKRKYRGGCDSGSDSSEASVFETESENSSVTESDSSDGSSSDYSSSSSDSEDERRRGKRQQKRRKQSKGYTSSESESSESDSSSDSESEDNRRNKRKGKRRSKILSRR